MKINYAIVFITFVIAYALYLNSPYDFWPNVGAEIIGILITVAVINEWIKFRDERREKGEKEIMEKQLKEKLSETLNKLININFNFLGLKCPYEIKELEFERHTRPKDIHAAYLIIRKSTKVLEKRKHWYKEKIKELSSKENFERFLENSSIIGFIPYKIAYKELNPIYDSLRSFELYYLKLLGKDESKILIEIRHSISNMLESIRQIEDFINFVSKRGTREDLVRWGALLPNISYSFIYDMTKNLNTLLDKGFFGTYPYPIGFDDKPYFFKVFTEEWFEKKINEFEKSYHKTKINDN